MVNERALMEAFQNIKKEFQSLRHDIEEINTKLNASNGHAHEHHEHHEQAPSPDLTSIREQLERLNYAEDDVIEAMELEALKTKSKAETKALKKNPIKEVDEFISDVNTEELAEDYY